MSESELKEWAESHAPAGSAVALAVLRLFEKLTFCQPVLDRAPEPWPIVRPAVLEAKKRIEQYIEEYKSDVLARLGPCTSVAIFDGSTGIPESRTAGRKEPMPPGAGQ